jgi:uncharacterized membrane protein HdeD (DUF308 family)
MRRTNAQRGRCGTFRVQSETGSILTGHLSVKESALASFPQLPPDSPTPEELQLLRQNWAWFAILGGVLIFLGCLAIGTPHVAGRAVVVVLSVALIIGGIAQAIGAFQSRPGKGFFLYLLIGVLYVVLGMLMIEHEIEALLLLTLLLAVSLLVGGVLRIVVALTERFHSRGWVLLNGVISVLLGIFIWRRWPWSGLWVIGLVVGVELIFNGLQWLMLGLAVRSVPREPQK